ncbi:zf-B_box domain-containing protein [Fagus crenata]
MDITSLFDISDIHHYSFNGKRMVFLHSRQQKLHVRLVDVAYKCESCGYELVDSSKFYSTKQRDSIKFCSMACKVTNMMISNVGPVYENELLSSLTINRSDGPHQSYRKRSRKGTPIRSPFF